MPDDTNRTTLLEILELSFNTSTCQFYTEFYQTQPENMIEKVSTYVTKQSELTEQFFNAMSYLVSDNSHFSWQNHQKTALFMMIAQRIFDTPSLINGPIVPDSIQFRARDLILAKLTEIGDQLAHESANPTLPPNIPLQKLRVLHWMLLSQYNFRFDDPLKLPMLNLRKLLGLRETLHWCTTHPHQAFSSAVIFRLMGLDPRDEQQQLSRYILLHIDHEAIQLAIIAELQSAHSSRFIEDARAQLSLVTDAIALGKLTLCRTLFEKTETNRREYFLLACATNQLTPIILAQSKRSFYYFFQLTDRFDDEGWEEFFLQGMAASITCNAKEAFQYCIKGDYILLPKLQHLARLIIQRKQLHFYTEFLNQEKHCWRELIKILLELLNPATAFNLIQTTINGRKYDQSLSRDQLYYFVSLLPADISNDLLHRVVTYLMTQQTQGEPPQTELERVECWIKLIENAISSADKRNVKQIWKLLKPCMAVDMENMITGRWEALSSLTSYLSPYADYPTRASTNVLLRHAAHAAQWVIVSTLLRQNPFKLSYSKTIGPVLRQAAQAQQFSLIIQFLKEFSTLITPEHLSINLYIEKQDQNEILFFAIMAEQWDTIRQLRHLLSAHDAKEKTHAKSDEAIVFKEALIRALRAIPLASERNWGLYRTILNLKGEDSLDKHDIENEIRRAMSSSQVDILTPLLTAPCLEQTFITGAFRQAINDKQWPIALVFIQNKNTNQLNQLTIEWAFDEVYRLLTGTYSSTLDMAAYTVYQTISNMTGINAPSAGKVTQVKLDVKKRYDLMAMLLSDSPSPHPLLEQGFFTTRAMTAGDSTLPQIQPH